MALSTFKKGSNAFYTNLRLKSVQNIKQNLKYMDFAQIFFYAFIEDQY